MTLFLYSFPTAAITSYYKYSGFKQNKCSVLQKKDIYIQYSVLLIQG